ncbi:DUF294 nucleotidyltransferase-like domain-containing protein [Melaminivora jejuensis]|uniref:putative nucleotidyltransferase substrate binding domain-containing protein n=1 Tax=Melaminivora jejuensis TaxID=1267217 RepID=UPI001E3CA0D5|nr:putative nucleotidyltransferase substrate binding domain-containing protein [Melaminivora jejuensis]UHJ65676.1 DUF294 nucleotidyltransferase-like domain-containing protein [Melaminivora jejuensis]
MEHGWDIAGLMATQRVLGALPESARQQLAGHWQEMHGAPAEVLLADGELSERLGWLLDGTLELADPQAGWSLPLRPGELFGGGVHGAAPGVQVVATTACRVLLLDVAVLQRMVQQYPWLQLLLPTLEGSTPVPAPAPALASGNLLAGPVGSLISRAPVCIDGSQSIRSAARRMAEAGVSSILLTQQGQLSGLLTDRDLRRRVLADGLDPERPVAEAATPAPWTLQRQQPIFDAMTLMARHHIHHLPVLDGGKLIGMVTASDLWRLQSPFALHLTQDIYRQGDLAGLVACSARVRHLQSSLARAGASAHSTGILITSVTDACTIRLIQLAEQHLGPAPVPYVWVAAGSQARMEQAARTDQDNCLVLSDDYRQEMHGAYFDLLARFVCDGLAACGYVHCPGGIMAMTPQWRQPWAQWDAYFSRWTRQPDAQALMLTGVFFDMRAVCGEAALLHSLRRAMLQRTRGNGLFLAHMVGNALGQRPPLGMFGQITVERGGDHPGTIDLKHGGIVPIIDLARVYALAGAQEAVNTHERLAVAADSGEVSAEAARDLMDTLEFIAGLRIAHQSRQIAAGQEPDNHLQLAELSSFERRMLKDAFGVVQKLQAVLGQRYQAGRF